MGVYDFTVTTANGELQPLEAYRGEVLLIVNTASKCGFTPQYKGLQQLYGEFQGQGFRVLGFPCNQFASQEPGTDEEIQQFCELNYQVTFPVFAKIDVNGPSADPLYKYLTHSAPGVLGTEGIKWNFTKFLIDRTGNVVKRFAPNTTPESIRDAIAEMVSRSA
ncbi:glutathione peroxidase [Alicyclobacillus curvatus]|nr:glutathione peroxidase [Alicyclobacillus curvatus]